MNANQIINMVVRTIMRRMINWGINAGMSQAGKLRRPKDTRDEDTPPGQDGPWRQ